jgi:hypothetical protein
MKMGNIPSPQRYDVGAYDTPPQLKMRGPTIARYASSPRKCLAALSLGALRSAITRQPAAMAEVPPIGGLFAAIRILLLLAITGRKQLQQILNNVIGWRP